MIREVLDFLKANEVEYRENYTLAGLSPIKIGGESSIVSFPDNISKLICLVNYLENIKIKHKIVGRMSNTLFSDSKYDGVVIRTDRIRQYEIRDKTVFAYCGVGLPRLAHACSVAGLSGLEALSGIPGSIAGAVIGNAGAFGGEISDRVISVSLFDKDTGEIIRLEGDKLGFSYRNSVLKGGGLVLLSCSLRMCESDPYTVKKETDRIREIRKNTQPTNMPSLGSTFKRPDTGTPAARLIDLCGLKGCCVGGCSVSEKHAGFIVNTGGGTADDYIELTEKVRADVFTKYAVRLHTEVEFV